MSKSRHDKTFTCPCCKHAWPVPQGMPMALIHPQIVSQLTSKHPDAAQHPYLCLSCLDTLRNAHIQDLFEAARQGLKRLDREAENQLALQSVLTENTNRQFESNLRFGERLSDRIAEFGGSWRFIVLFLLLIAVWIMVNTVVLMRRPFDPYPFILLNLGLSCIAALQAPIIMMSQNRQEAKDRLRAENDFKVNLKAELEIQHLHAKLDLLLTHQWQQLLDIQEMQLETMETILQKSSSCK